MREDGERMLFSFLAEGELEKKKAVKDMSERLSFSFFIFLLLCDVSSHLSRLFFLLPPNSFLPNREFLKVPQQCLSVHKGGRRDMTTKRFVCF